jgi:hypothetical protein
MRGNDNYFPPVTTISFLVERAAKPDARRVPVGFESRRKMITEQHLELLWSDNARTARECKKARVFLDFSAAGAAEAGKVGSEKERVFSSAEVLLEI